MTETMLFYAAYASQILLLSFYFPRKVLGRMRQTIETYPPSEYPKLYPEPLHDIERKLRTYRNLNAAIILLGVALLLVAVLSGYPIGAVNDADVFVMVYTAVQLSPMFLLSHSELRYFKRMRAIAQSTTRKAELRPRRLFDFVSPTLVGLAIVMYVVAIAVLLYVVDPSHLYTGTIPQIALVTACNLALAAMVVQSLRGRKTDPHQAYEDRMRQMELIAKSMIVLSILLSTFIAMSNVLDSLGLDRFGPLLISVYVQLMFLAQLRSFLAVRFDNVHFEVYKQDPSPGPHEAPSPR